MKCQPIDETGRTKVQNPALPAGTRECTKCDQRGLRSCNDLHGYTVHRAHFHHCECCKGEGVHREEVPSASGKGSIGR